MFAFPCREVKVNSDEFETRGREVLCGLETHEVVMKFLLQNEKGFVQVGGNQEKVQINVGRKNEEEKLTVMSSLLKLSSSVFQDILEQNEKLTMFGTGSYMKLNVLKLEEDPGDFKQLILVI